MFIGFVLVIGLFFILPILIILGDIVLFALKAGHIVKFPWKFMLIPAVITFLYFSWMLWMEHH